MTKRIATLGIAVAAVATLACGEDMSPTDLTVAPQAGQVETGNGAPSGSHYTLNIIGVRQDKMNDIDANNDNGVGNRIFVQLNGGDDVEDIRGKKLDDISKVNKIFLQTGDNFAVLDANATAHKGEDGALFQLPADVSQEWVVFARPLGTPGGKATLTTCATVIVDPTPEDPESGDEFEEVVCSEDSEIFIRDKGKSSFQNVSDTLLFLNLLVDPEEDPELAECLELVDTPDSDDPAVDVTLPLFDPCLETFFWNYDNKGLKLLQLRFYPASALEA